MNFTKRIKEELTGETFQSSCCKAACLSAFLRTSGSILTRGGLIGFSFFTENEKVACFFNKIIKDLYGIDGVYSGKNSGGKDKITCEYVGENTFGALIELGILVAGENGVGVEMGVDKYLIETECCKRAYVCGAFLGGGSCTIPNEKAAKNTGYHLEFVFSYYETAHAFSELLAEFDIIAKLIERKKSFVVYVKSNEEIQEILTLIGAEKCSLALAETVIIKDYSNNANRKSNCDLGNINKQIEAAERQIAAINAIKETIGLEALKKELFDVCELRLSDEFLTLEEMSEKLGVSKSCVNHRMRKIIEIANSVS